MSKQLSGTLIYVELARGMAAMMIFIFHLIMLGQARYEAFPFDVTPWVPFLSGSVDLFFLISGFLMMHTTQSAGNRHPASFLVKRFIRIFPAYWLVLGAQLVALLVKPEWFHNLSTAHPSILHSVFLLPHHTLTILMVAWTLVFEMYFYWVFAATLFLTRKIQFIALTVFFIACVTAGYFYPMDNAIGKLVTSPLLLEFTAGMSLAMLWPILPRAKFLPVLYMVVAALWLWLAPFPQQDRVLSSGLPFLFIFLACLTLEKQGAALSPKPVLFFGGISYALYLVHAPMISAMPVLARVFHSTLPLPYFLIPAAVFSLISAVLLHFYFEITVQKQLRQLCRLNNKSSQLITMGEIITQK